MVPDEFCNVVSDTVPDDSGVRGQLSNAVPDEGFLMWCQRSDF